MCDNVLLEQGGLPCVLPFVVHLDLGHLPDTQGFSGLILEPLARFKRRYEVKKKYAPPFKMFLFIFREASEKKIPKKMKFSGCC